MGVDSGTKLAAVRGDERQRLDSQGASTACAALVGAIHGLSANMPTDWRPQQVRNPQGVLDEYFTEAAAWELIATRLEEGHPMEVVSLRKPPGRKGYVMEISLGDDNPPVYVKLQLGSGKVIGRSFHYSERP